MSQDLGSTIDQLYELREQRLALDRKVKEMKEEEVRIREQIFELLAAAGLKRASGGIATAGITVKVVPLVEDWDLVHDYIRKTGEFDLLEKRIGKTAWRARVEDGIDIPGVSAVEDVDISLTRASRG
jgi:hypothetical protein